LERADPRDLVLVEFPAQMASSTRAAALSVKSSLPFFSPLLSYKNCFAVIAARHDVVKCAVVFDS